MQVYEGQKYKLTLSFPNDYPFRPPTVKASGRRGYCGVQNVTSALVALKPRLTLATPL